MWKYCNSKYGWIWLCRDVRSAYYWWVHGIKIGHYDETVLPDLGPGQFVSVYRKGSLIDIIDEKNPRMVRIIPSQSSHGLMVEVWEEGHLSSRRHLAIEQLVALSGRRWADRPVQASMFDDCNEDAGENHG